MVGASPSQARAKIRTRVIVGLDIGGQVLPHLPKRPAAVVRRSQPLLELIYEGQLTQEEKEALRSKLVEILGPRYRIEISDEVF